MPSPCPAVGPQSCPNRFLDGLRRRALRTMRTIEDLAAILRATRDARGLLKTPDAALTTRGLARSDAIPHAFAGYFDQPPPAPTARR